MLDSSRDARIWSCRCRHKLSRRWTASCNFWIWDAFALLSSIEQVSSLAALVYSSLIVWFKASTSCSHDTILKHPLQLGYACAQGLFTATKDTHLFFLTKLNVCRVT